MDLFFPALFNFVFASVFFFDGSKSFRISNNTVVDVYFSLGFFFSSTLMGLKDEKFYTELKPAVMKPPPGRLIQSG